MALVMKPDKNELRMIICEGGCKRWSLLTPEHISCRDRAASGTHIKPNTWRRTKKGWRVSQELPEMDVSHNTEFAAVDRGTIELVYTVTNEGKADMLETEANFCFACAGNPWNTGAEYVKESWVDEAFHGSRKEINTDWTKRSLVPTVGGLRPIGDINVVFPVAFNRRIAGAKNMAEYPLVLCQSVDGKETYAAGFERGSGLECCINSCIHVIAWLGTVEAGRTKKVCGRFYYMKADPYQIVARYQRDFKIE